MNTGAMTGADAPALRALAGQMSASAARLDGMRQNVRARLYSINWQGPDGADFRRAWDGQHAPMLSRVAEGLRASAATLLREAAQQEEASTAGGGALGSGLAGSSIGGEAPGGDLLDIAETFNKAYGVFLGVSSAFLGLVEKLYAKEVSPHWRDGKRIQEYHRWARGKAEALNRTIGSADNVVKFGKFVPYLSGVSAGINQWQQDERAKTDGVTFRPGEQQARALASGVVTTGVDVVTDTLLIGGGTLIAGPAGGLIGYGLSTGISFLIEEPLADAVAGGVSLAYDVGEYVIDAGQAAVDFGADALEAGGDLLDAGTDLAEDAGEAVGNFFTGVTSWGR